MDRRIFTSLPPSLVSHSFCPVVSLLPPLPPKGGQGVEVGDSVLWIFSWLFWPSCSSLLAQPMFFFFLPCPTQTSELSSQRDSFSLKTRQTAERLPVIHRGQTCSLQGFETNKTTCRSVSVWTETRIDQVAGTTDWTSGGLDFAPPCPQSVII